MTDPKINYTAIRDVHSTLSHIPISQNDMADIVELYNRKTEINRLESQLIDIVTRLDELGQNIRFRSEPYFGTTLYSGNRYLSYKGYEWTWAE